MNRQFRFLMLLAGLLVVIGLLFPVMVAADTPTAGGPAAGATTLLYDDFSGPLTWVVQRGKAWTENGWAVLQRNDWTDSRDTAIMHSENAPWTDYTFRTRVHSDGGGNKWYGGWLLFRIQDLHGWNEGTFYILGFNTPAWGSGNMDSNDIGLTRVNPAPQGYTELAHFHPAAGILNNYDNTVQVTVTGARIQVWINDHPVIDLVDSDPILSGGVGLLSIWEARTRYDYAEVTTASPGSELLVNGSFEVDADNNFVPDSWTRKDTLVDARRCNQVGQSPVAYDGNCAYMFKGGTNDTARLFQTVNLNGYALQPGDKIKLTGFYHKQSAGTVYVRLFVNYATLPEDQGMVSMTKQTDGYQPIPALAKRLQAVPTRIHVLIQNKTTSGKTYLDGMSLKWVSKSGSGVIPLPPSADNPVPLPSGK